MTKEEKIEFIDDFLARCEDWMHGKDGEDVSVCRKYFSELEQQLGKTEQLSDGWISVDDELPEEHQDVMVYYYGNRNSKHWPELQFMKQSSFYDGRFECDEDVTHWMPLPNQPKQR